MESTATKADLKAISKTISEIKFQDTSIDIWENKYCLKTKQGVALDVTMDDTYKRGGKSLVRS